MLMFYNNKDIIKNNYRVQEYGLIQKCSKEQEIHLRLLGLEKMNLEIKNLNKYICFINTDDYENFLNYLDNLVLQNKNHLYSLFYDEIPDFEYLQTRNIFKNSKIKIKLLKIIVLGLGEQIQVYQNDFSKHLDELILMTKSQ
jgi:hypothetical protein